MFSGNLGCGIQYSMNIEIMHAWIQNYAQVKISKSGVNWWRGHLLQPFWIQPSCWILLCTSDKFKSDIHLSLSRAISLIIRKQILKIVLKMSRLMRKWAYDICKQQSFRWACAVSSEGKLCCLLSQAEGHKTSSKRKNTYTLA